jgi:hypothetical protein
MISKLSKSQNKPTSEISTELEQLEKSGQVKCWWDGTYYYAKAIEREKVTFEPTKPIQAPPIAYDVYTYMKMLHVGEEHAIHMKDLAEHFDISDRKLREIVANINEGIYTLKNGNVFTRKIFGDLKLGYYLVSNDREMKKHLRSIDIEFYNIIRKRNVIREHYGLDNQTKLSLSEWEKDLVKSISTDL